MSQRQLLRSDVGRDVGRGSERQQLALDRIPLVDSYEALMLTPTLPSPTLRSVLEWQEKEHVRQQRPKLLCMLLTCKCQARSHMPHACGLMPLATLSVGVAGEGAEQQQ